MKNQLLHNYRLFLFVIALLFSLSPCKVKSSLFESFGLTYEQTLNQSKVTSKCNSSCFISLKVIGSKSVAVFNSNFPDLKSSLSIKEENIEKQLFAKKISLQFPPKYILYKQFKFDVV